MYGHFLRELFCGLFQGRGGFLIPSVIPVCRAFRIIPLEKVFPPFFCPPAASFLRRGGELQFGHSLMRSLARPSRNFHPARPLIATFCVSRMNFLEEGEKGGGYYRFAHVNQIALDAGVYEIHTKRGSGPGGQGTNSSSNKVELRVDLEMLSGFFDEEIIKIMRKNEHQKALTRDGATLVVSCHEHRSALQNKEACIRKVKEIIRKASWVPFVDAEPIKTGSNTISHSKMERRQKRNFMKMQRAARKGNW
ncbi:unnamed protein product [Phytomonas sp. Hart1]|nr:unnamed protein product [Phytomonas sp. Hart1]|eukprot:CCW68015.1 unnamed protein product [Phytomonas sp. isolate Hart1]